MFKLKWRENQATIKQLGVSRSYMLIEHKYKDGSSVYELLKRDSVNRDCFISIGYIGSMIKCLKIIEEAGEHIIII